MFQLREKSVELTAACVVVELVGIRHMSDKKIEQALFVGVDECTVGVAPFAVFFVECAVRFTADEVVCAHRHPATLANGRIGVAKNRVHGHAELFGQKAERVGVRQGIAVFPAADGLPCYHHAAGKCVLRQVILFSERFYDFFRFHRNASFSMIVANRTWFGKQLAVALRFIECSP